MSAGSRTPRPTRKIDQAVDVGSTIGGASEPCPVTLAPLFEYTRKQQLLRREIAVDRREGEVCALRDVAHLQLVGVARLEHESATLMILCRRIVCERDSDRAGAGTVADSSRLTACVELARGTQRRFGLEERRHTQSGGSCRFVQ